MDGSAAQSALLRHLASRPLVRSNGVALHRQCKDLLKSLLDDLHYPPAVPLPAENEMARVLGISRPTLRQAMASLSSDGVIHSQRGVGAFALRPGLVRPVGLSSLYRDLQADQRSPTTRVLVIEEAAADEKVASELHIPIGTRMQHIERLRLADGVPVVLTRSLLALPDGISLTAAQLESDGLYNLLHRLAGIELIGGSQSVSARMATDGEAELLDVDQPAAVMVAHRVAFDTEGRGVEYVHIIYPEGTELISDLRGTSVRAAIEPRPETLGS